MTTNDGDEVEEVDQVDVPTAIPLENTHSLINNTYTNYVSHTHVFTRRRFTHIHWVHWSH
jgi:hypothetical protein